MEKAEAPRTIEDLHSAVAEAPEFDELRDTATRRTRLYQLIAENPDPLWREIGQQLLDGHMHPSQVLSVPQYREHLQAGMADGLARLTELTGALQDHLRGAEGQPPAGGADANAVADQSDLDVSEALGPILRRR